MTTQNVVEHFVWGEEKGKASGGRLRIEGKRLINFDTTIAQRMDNLVIINITKYSPTTTKHQNRLCRMIGENDNVIFVSNVPVGAYDLKRFIA